PVGLVSEGGAFAASGNCTAIHSFVRHPSSSSLRGLPREALRNLKRDCFAFARNKGKTNAKRLAGTPFK
ncbi:MAG: hypothetical protein ACPLPS_09460, partial [bacterium]